MNLLEEVQYNEYEIKPIETNNLEESIFVINSLLSENQINRQTPIIGDKVYNEG